MGKVTTGIKELDMALGKLAVIWRSTSTNIFVLTKPIVASAADHGFNQLKNTFYSVQTYLHTAEKTRYMLRRGHDNLANI